MKEWLNIVQQKLVLEKEIKKWFNKECKKAKQERDMAWKVYQMHTEKETWDRYKEAKSNLRMMQQGKHMKTLISCTTL